jgi:hypothetical protein
VVLAQDELLGGKLRTGETVSVPSSETVDGDLYLFAGTITMDGTVDGDLVAMGGTVNVSGTVTGDLLVAGGTLVLGGTVEGDARIGGGQVTISSEIAEDAIVTGGQMTLAGDGSVGGDLIAGGGQVSVAGDVAGNIEASAGTYDRTGTVGGTEHIVESPPDAPARAPTVTDRILDALRHFVALLLIGGLALWLLPRFFRRAEGELRTRPWWSLLWGLLTCVGWVVLALAILLATILLAIVFGLLQLGALVALDVITGLMTLGTIAFLLVVALAFIADVVVGMTIGRLASPSDAPSRWMEFGLLAAGLAVVVILTSLPVIGGIAKLAVVLFGLGALALAAWSARRGRKTDAAAPSEPPTTAPSPPAPSV